MEIDIKMASVKICQDILIISIALVHVSFLSKMYYHSDTIALIAEAEGMGEDEVDEYTIEDTRIADEELKKNFIKSSGFILAALFIGIWSLITSNKNVSLAFSVSMVIISVGGLSNLPTYSSGVSETLLDLFTASSSFYYSYTMSRQKKSKIGII